MHCFYFFHSTTLYKYLFLFILLRVKVFDNSFFHSELKNQIEHGNDNISIPVISWQQLLIFDSKKLTRTKSKYRPEGSKQLFLLVVDQFYFHLHPYYHDRSIDRWTLTNSTFLRNRYTHISRTPFFSCLYTLHYGFFTYKDTMCKETKNMSYSCAKLTTTHRSLHTFDFIYPIDHYHYV